jgi:hypothetical protein
MLFSRLAIAVLLACLTPSQALGDGPVDFRREVAPIFEQHCLRCHQPGNTKGKVSLATFHDLSAGEYVVPGRPEESGLLDLLTAPAPDERPEMPKEGKPLSPEQVAALRRWIASGADWPKGLVLQEKARAGTAWWSLRPLAEVEPPERGAGVGANAAPDAWLHHPIDRFVLAKLQEKGLRPSPHADRRSLIRRLTYDLTGLPPSPEEVDAFVADGSDEAYQAVVDRLLASPHYGEHWGRHWLDVVRFGESTGYERNITIDNAWPFRDYVIQSFNHDKPFNRFILEQLAGDVVGPGDPAVEAGTGFLVCGAYDNVNSGDPVLNAARRADAIDDMIRCTSEAFLGLTIGCARCHNHKFDPITQQDYYSLYATFSGVEHASRVVATPVARRSYETQVGSIQAEQTRLTSEKVGLEKRIVARAEEQASHYEAGWVRPPAEPSLTEERFDPVETRFVRLIVEGRRDNPNLNTGYALDEFEVWTTGGTGAARNVALAANGGRAEGVSRVAEDFADAYSARHTNDGEYGSPWVAFGPELTIALAKPERIERVVFSNFRGIADDPKAFRIPFVGDYRIVVSDDGAAWTEVASSRDRQPMSPAWRRKRLLDLEATAEEQVRLAALARDLEQLKQRLGAVPPLPSWSVGAFRKAAGPFVVHVGGDPQRKGDPVTCASLSCLSTVTHGYELSDGASESDRRLALARWLVDPKNPLTPRVLANRLWQYHFGIGIVDTPSDFGAMGSRPTHPELLDWLARQVLAQGWQLKPLHRLIVTSQTYQQAASFRAEAAAVDAGSRFLWRFPPRRLSAEEVRDTILWLSGRLDRRLGGPGFRLYHYIEDNVATYVPLDEPGPETYRRAVYHQNARASQVDVLSDFDCPDFALATPRRAITTTPLQALTLMNHRFTLDMASALAGRLATAAGSDDPGGQVRRAFLLAYGRPPDAEEITLSVRLIRQHGLRAFCRALLNSNELISLN